MRSILIADYPGGSFGMPWRGDAPCFNFNYPREHLRPEELDKIGDKTDIETLVIGVDLPDYGFISELVNLRQLYIYSGKNLKDIEFIRPLVGLRQLYIYESQISSLEPFEALAAEKSRLYQESSKDLKAIITYPFEAVCIRSDFINCDLRELKKYDSLRTRELYIKKNPQPEDRS